MTYVVEDADELFGLAPEEFVPARNALAARLRDEGRGDAADAVKALRKPTVSAWAVNQLARRHRDEIDELLRAGAALSSAQQQALGGGDASRLRAASRARNDLVARLRERAEAILSEAGIATARAHLERVTGSLLAAGDADVSDVLRRGCLTRDLEPAGFATALGEVWSAAVATDEDQDRGLEDRDRAAERRAGMRLEARKLADLARAAQTEADRLERAADEAERAATKAREDARRARAAAAEAHARARRANRALAGL